MLFLHPSGGAQDHRDGPGHEPLHWICSASSVDPLCSSVRSHWALCNARWLYAAHHLSPLKGPITHQGPERCYWWMSTGHLHVRTSWKPLAEWLGWFPQLREIKMALSYYWLPYYFLIRNCRNVGYLSSDVIYAFFRHLRPSMLQQLVRRLVFDVPQLTEYCKMPIKVSLVNSKYKYATIQKFGLVRFLYVFVRRLFLFTKAAFIWTKIL